MVAGAYISHNKYFTGLSQFLHDHNEQQNICSEQNGLPHHLPQPLGYGRVGALDLNIYIVRHAVCTA